MKSSSSKKSKIIFFGTSAFAAEVLSYLLKEGENIVAVVTRPDRPFGRSLKSSAPPVKVALEKLGSTLPLYQPEKASTPEFAATLQSYAPDLFVVVAYGEIIKRNLLDIPKLGNINVHASLLPKYRGAAPMQRALMDGCKETGVTIMEMVLEMDAGDILEMVKLSIPENMTLGELDKELCTLACPALVQVIHAKEEGSIQKIAQNPSHATFAPKITPLEEKIDWNRPARKIHDQIRALSPRPGAWCFVEIGGEKKRLKILRTKFAPEKSGKPGSFLSFDAKEGWVVACGEGALALLEVQLEGKKAMPVDGFINGIRQQISFIQN